MENIIVLKGGEYADIRKAFDRWVEASSGTLEADLSFEFYKGGPGIFIIKADDKLPNDRFSFLLNYLVYPEDMDNRSEITGYTTIADHDFFPTEKIGEDIFIFIPADDDEYDVVYWVMKNNRVYKTDFGGKTTESVLSKIYPEFVFDPNEYAVPEIITTM